MAKTTIVSSLRCELCGAVSAPFVGPIPNDILDWWYPTVWKGEEESYGPVCPNHKVFLDEDGELALWTPELGFELQEPDAGEDKDGDWA
jgi:hypothetical protein